MKTEEIFKNKVDEVKVMFPSLFTKEDVIAIISELEDAVTKNQPKSINENFIENLKSALRDSIGEAIENVDEDDVVDKNNFEFSIGYGNRIEVDNMNLDLSNLISECSNIIDETIDEVVNEFEEQEEEKEEEEA